MVDETAIFLLVGLQYCVNAQVNMSVCRTTLPSSSGMAGIFDRRQINREKSNMLLRDIEIHYTIIYYSI
jgi:hypothetical protein